MRAAVVVFVICALACIVAHAAILVSVVRRRSAAVTNAVPRPRLAIEVVWALLPAIALAFVLTATWARLNRPDTPAPDLIMKIAR